MHSPQIYHAVLFQSKSTLAHLQRQCSRKDSAKLCCDCRTGSVAVHMCVEQTRVEPAPG